MLTGMILFSLLVVACLSLLVRFLIQHQKQNALTKHMTQIGPRHPVWGHLHLFQNIKEFYDQVFAVVEKTHAKVLCCWVMVIRPYIFVCHPDTAKTVIKEMSDKPTHIHGAYKFIKPWLGDGLVLSGSRKWERNRRLLTPAFHFDILRPYVFIYNDVADTFLDKLQKSCSAGEVVEISSLVTLATLDTMLRCALSYKGHIQEMGSSHPYVEAVSQLTKLVVNRSLKPWLHPDFIYWLSSEGREFNRVKNYVHQFADEIIQSRRRALNENPEELSRRYLDFLDVLISAKDENGDGLSDLDIRSEVDTFLFEGHDTTSSSITWAIYSLAKYQEEQNLVYKEVIEVLNGRERLEWNDIPSLKYMSLFLKEVKRTHSPVPTISRISNKPMTLEGVQLPANTKVDILIHAINHHPDVWPDHKEFRPRRFEEETRAEKNPYAYIPFSAGPRNCIGQNFAVNEEKVMIGSLLKRFKVSLVDGHVYEHSPLVVMKSTYGVKIKLEQRQ